MNSFSWKDGVHAAVSSCLPCFSGGGGSTSDSENENGRTRAIGRQTRFDELEGLLGDTDDAETMSLHSDIGHGRQQRRKKRRTHKHIQLFGFNLFGRPPIHLSDSDDEDTLDSERQRRLVFGQNASAHSSSSGSAFDPDAAPLDPADISRLTAQDAAARAADLQRARQAEEQRRKEEREEREERRRRRKERKELKRVAEAIANGATMNMDGEEFEGFPGSGGLATPTHLPVSQSAAHVLDAPVEEFGPHVGGANPPTADDPADADADFGGEVYVRKPRLRGSDSSRSQTRSQTSASQSNAGSSQGYGHHYIYQASPLPSPSASDAQSPSVPGFPMHTAPQKKKKKNLSTVQTRAANERPPSPPTSQSASLPSLDSPVATTPTLSPHIVNGTEQTLPNGSSAFAAMQADKFPIVGFGGIRRMDSASSGAFLANRGDE